MKLYKLHDSYNRQITYLRMSVTEQCNYNCMYCKPIKPLRRFRQHSQLCTDSLIRIAQILAQFGIQKIRLTGGEPLLRPDLPILIRKLHQLPAIKDVSLTTNGQFLHQQLDEIIKSGLTRLNISLDSMKPERFAQITGGGQFQTVWDGILLAERNLPGPIKINMVVSKGWNEDEITDFARLTCNFHFHVRFIESMPMVKTQNPFTDRFYPIENIKQRIEETFSLKPILPEESHYGPACIYQIPGAKGKIGFIGALTHPFCANCNRIRLTSDGKLRACLLSNHEIDFIPLLNENLSNQEIHKILQRFLQTKPANHNVIPASTFYSNRSMTQIGG